MVFRGAEDAAAADLREEYAAGSVTSEVVTNVVVRPFEAFIPTLVAVTIEYVVMASIVILILVRVLTLDASIGA